MQKAVSRSITGQGKLTVFVFVWTIGLSFGLFCGSCGTGTLSAHLNSALSAKISIGVLLSALPTVLCVLFGYFGLQYLIFPLSYLKAFFDGFMLFALSYAFGSALWLVYWLLFFTDRCLNVLFLLLSSQILLREEEGQLHLPLLITVITVTVSLDFFLISPLLHKLLL